MAIADTGLFYIKVLKNPWILFKNDFIIYYYYILERIESVERFYENYYSG
ncbi:MAG: hypothetical protein IIT65_13680 [Lachnospiraceae bacterium]|nr:hypothetical protein [Lachnospiraceae bacterium]